MACQDSFWAGVMAQEVCSLVEKQTGLFLNILELEDGVVKLEVITYDGDGSTQRTPLDLPVISPPHNWVCDKVTNLVEEMKKANLI